MSSASARYHSFGDSKDEYIFEVVEGHQAHMTGRRKGVRQGDYIRICRGGQQHVYQILTIEYYASPRNIWTALLALISIDS